MNGGFVASLGAGERAALGSAGRPRTYHRGDHLFLEGDRGDAVYLVSDGRARVYTASSEGHEVTLCVRGPGDLVGEMAALDPGSARSASVVALGTLRCQVIGSDELHRLLEAHPRVSLALLRLLIGRLRDADRRRTEFGSYNATQRLARVLVEASDQSVGGGSVAAGNLPGLALSQQEMAGLIGASRESVARALAELRDRGLVATGRRTIAIRDHAGLRRYAG